MIKRRCKELSRTSWQEQGVVKTEKRMEDNMDDLHEAEKRKEKRSHRVKKNTYHHEQLYCLRTRPVSCTQLLHSQYCSAF